VVEFFQECITIYCGLTSPPEFPFLKMMPSNEMLMTSSLIKKNRLFESAFSLQSPSGHVNVLPPLVNIICLVKKITPEQSLMSSLPLMMASRSSAKVLTHLIVGDSDGSLETLGTSDGKRLLVGDSDGSLETLGTSDGLLETLGTSDGKRLLVGDSDGSLETLDALGPLEGLGALDPLEGFGALEPLEGFGALEPLEGFGALQPLEGFVALEPLEGSALA
jgi:hypothetical protein